MKLEIGGPIFAQSFVDKLNTKFLHGSSLRGERIGIIGLGSIGRGVANLAAGQGNTVCFYDPNPDLQLRSSLHERITRVGSLEELMRSCDYVFGCSGRNPFEGKWPLEHRPGAKLFSVSGGDQEFGPIIKDLRTKPDFKVKPERGTSFQNMGHAVRFASLTLVIHTTSSLVHRKQFQDESYNSKPAACWRRLCRLDYTLTCSKRVNRTTEAFTECRREHSNLFMTGGSA